MERTWHALRTNDWSTAYAVIEGADVDDEALLLDKEHVASLVAAAAPGFVRTVKDFAKLANERGYTLDEAKEIFGTEEILWKGDGILRVIVDDTNVEIQQVVTGGEAQVTAREQLFAALRADGLFVIDPVREKVVSG
jgi:hypothetical protein